VSSENALAKNLRWLPGGRAKPGDLVLVTAHNSKSARIDVNGKTATIPLSVTDLEDH